MTGYTVNYSWPYPEGGDRVAVHSDIAGLAKAADASLIQATEGSVVDFSDAPLGSSDDLDALPLGFRVHTVWSGAVAEALGLPTATSGTILSDRYGANAGTQMWFPRVIEGAQMWSRNEFSGGWTQWAQIGAGSGDNAPMLRAAPSSGYKTAPLALTLGHGGSSTSGSGTTAVVQYVPVATRRMQLHLRNWNPRYVNADGVPVAINSTLVGLHTGGGASDAWTAFPNSAGVTSVDGGSSEYLSGWIDVPPEWQGQEIVVRYGWSSSGTIQRNIGTGFSWDGTAYVPDNTPPLFGWLEVEVPSSTPVVAAFGDSLSSGVSSARPVVDSWIDQWARANDAVPAHWSHSGDKAVTWTSATTRKWGMYGWDIAAPDAMVYLMGSNDLSEASITLADMQERIASTAGLIRGMITPNLYAGTIFPRTNQATGSTFETVRREVNAWLPESGIFRDIYATSAAISGDDETILPAYDADGIHLNTAGYSAVAGAVAPSPVGAAGSATVTYVGDGVYEIA